MELYLRWLAKNETEVGEESPIGIILCAGKNTEQIELLELGSAGIHVAEYLTVLPPPAVLREKLHKAIEAARMRIGTDTQLRVFSAGLRDGAQVGLLHSVIRWGRVRLNDTSSLPIPEPIVQFGKTNWLHLGSKEAGPKIAAIFSIVQSCRKLGIPIRQYLADVLPGLGDRFIKELTRLTPTAYAAKLSK